MEEVQNMSRRCLRSESDKGVVVTSSLSGEETTPFIISGGSVGGSVSSGGGLRGMITKAAGWW